MAVRILNPQPAPLESGPQQLVRALLDAARASDLRETERLAGQLQGFDPLELRGREARLAFWLNLYNALVRHAFALDRPRGHLYLHLGLFNRFAYQVGGQRYTPNAIEHGILRANRRAPDALLKPFRAGDPRLQVLPPGPMEPRMHFAINCGANSCPPIRAYEPERVEAQLDLATRAYFTAECRLDREAGRVTLPRLLKIYAGDFGSEEERVRFAARHLEGGDANWLAEQVGRVRVGFGRYDWQIAS